MSEKRPFGVAPDTDDNLSAVEQVKRAIQLREAKRLKAQSYVDPYDRVAHEEIHIDPEALNVNHAPVKESETAKYLRTLKEESAMKAEAKQTQPRERAKGIKYPEGFHDCGDPKCGAHEIIRLKREEDRVRKSKTSPSGRS